MRLTRGKIVIIPIVVAIGLTFLGLVIFTFMEEAEISPHVSVVLTSVHMDRIDADNPAIMYVRADFTIFNDTDKVLTISRITYDMYANDIFIGEGLFSWADHPLVGRPPLFDRSTTTIPVEMSLHQSPDNIEVWNMLRDGDTDNIQWRAEGMAQIETAFSIIEKDFVSTL